MGEDQIVNEPSRAIRVVRNIVGGTISGAAWTTMMGSFAITAHWVRLAPKTPDPARGMIVEHSEHGWITYFTEYQNNAQYSMLFGGLFIFFLAILLFPKTDIVHRTGFLSWRTDYKVDDPEGIQGWASGVGVFIGLGLIYLVDPALTSWLAEWVWTHVHS